MSVVHWMSRVYVCACVVHLIVATPGRILDLMNKELVRTDTCKILVLDEVCTRQPLNELMLQFTHYYYYYYYYYYYHFSC